MGYCILIPTVNRKDLLRTALDWYISNLKSVEIIVLDNGKQGIASGHPNLKVFESAENLGVAGSWNWLMNKAIERGHENFLLLHDDVVLKRYEEEIDKLISSSNDYIFYLPELYFHTSAMVINKKTFKKIGQFDEGYRFYSFEISDYLYRAELKDVGVYHSDLLNPQTFKSGQSIVRSPILNYYGFNRQYYRDKWGGLPAEEKFKTPFNL